VAIKEINGPEMARGALRIVSARYGSHMMKEIAR
jgi:hypothetical protein